MAQPWHSSSSWRRSWQRPRSAHAIWARRWLSSSRSVQGPPDGRRGPLAHVLTLFVWLWVGHARQAMEAAAQSADAVADAAAAAAQVTALQSQLADATRHSAELADQVRQLQARAVRGTGFPWHTQPSRCTRPADGAKRRERHRCGRGDVGAGGVGGCAGGPRAGPRQGRAAQDARGHGRAAVCRIQRERGARFAWTPLGR